MKTGSTAASRISATNLRGHSWVPDIPVQSVPRDTRPRQVDRAKIKASRRAARLARRKR